MTAAERPLNDEMYMWRADAQRFIGSSRAAEWADTFAARVVWLVNELEAKVTALSQAQRERDAALNAIALEAAIDAVHAADMAWHKAAACPECGHRQTVARVCEPDVGARGKGSCRCANDWHKDQP